MTGQEPDAQPHSVAAATTDVEDLLRQAMVAPTYDRQPFRLAIRGLPPQPRRFCALIAGVPAGHRPDAVRLLAEAWGPVDSAELRPLLTDASAPVRAATLSALSPSGDDVALLRRLLRDDLSTEVRLAAVAALARASEQDQLGALGLALADPDPEVRASSVETLPVAGTSRGATHVLAAAEDRHRTVRAAAYRRLIGAPAWVLWMALGGCSRRPELLLVLDEGDAAGRVAALVLERVASPDVGDRVLALELAGYLLAGPEGRLVAESSELVAEAVRGLTDPEAVVRRSAAAMLSGYDQAVPSLVRTVGDDPDPGVRCEAVRALAEHDVEAAIAALLDALRDPDPEVRRLAVEALLRHPSGGLARRLAGELTNSNLDSVGQVLLGMASVGEEALTAAVGHGPPERTLAAAALLSRPDTMSRLLAHLRAVDPAVRLGAVEVLGAIHGRDALDGLVTALRDSCPEIRARAVHHLGRRSGEAARQAVQEVADSDRTPEVREAAGDAIRHVAGPTCMPVRDA